MAAWTKPESRSSTSYCKLRKKLAAAIDGDNYIETVWARAMCCAIHRTAASRRGRRRLKV